MRIESTLCHQNDPQLSNFPNSESRHQASSSHHTSQSSGSSAITVSNFLFAGRSLFLFFIPFKSDLWGRNSRWNDEQESSHCQVLRVSEQVPMVESEELYQVPWDRHTSNNKHCKWPQASTLVSNLVPFYPGLHVAVQPELPWLE